MGHASPIHPGLLACAAVCASVGAADHEKNLKATDWSSGHSDGPDGYYAIGVRCSY